jgi:opacity protein-like surface antigen
MKKAAAGIFAALATVAFAGGAHAQIVPNLTPFSVEVRGGVAFPTGDMKDGVKTGYTTSANVTFHALPMLGIYGGYTLNNFDSKSADVGTVTEHGADAGVRLDIPTPLIPIDPFIRAGAVFHKVQLNDTPLGDIKSDNKLGFEVGAGAAFALGPKVSVTPAVSYTRINNLKFGGTSSDVDLSHVRADIGLRIRI